MVSAAFGGREEVGVPQGPGGKQMAMAHCLGSCNGGCIGECLRKKGHDSSVFPLQLISVEALVDNLKPDGAYVDA